MLNILTGLGPDAGAPLVSHPDVDKVLSHCLNSIFSVMHIVLYVTVCLIMQIAFTGSSATGSKIMASAAQLVRVSHNANLLPRKSITLLWFG